MLGILRRKSQSPYLQATVVIIALVFIFWGAKSANIDNQGGSNSVATVNGRKIPFEEYRRSYDQIINRYRDQFGGSIPEKLLETLNLKEKVLDQLVERTLIQQGAQKVGLIVSKEELRDKIQEMEVFKKNSAFDVALYKEILNASRLSVSEFETNMRSDLLTSKVLDHLSRFARVVPGEIEERVKRDYSQVRFAYLVFDPALFIDKVKPGAEEIGPFFEKNKEKYKTDPQVSIRYLAFLFNEDSAAAQTSEEDINSYYSQNAEKFKLPEQRLLSHILIKADQSTSADQLTAKKKQSAEILAKLKAGKDFAALAKQYSEDSSAAQGGLLGLIARGQTVQSFEDAAFALPEGGLSGAVQSQFGFHIIKVLKIQPARSRSLAEVRPEISQIIGHEKSKPITFKRANTTYEQIILAGSLDKGAGSAKIKETGFITQNSASGVVPDPLFAVAALKLKRGELSSLIEGRDGYYILSAKETKDPEVPPLAAVKERVKNDLAADRAKLLAKESATKALAELRAGALLIDVAKKYGITPQASEYVSKNSAQGSNLPGPVIQAAVEMTEKAPCNREVIDVDGLYYLTRLTDHKTPNPEILATKQKEFQKRLEDENSSLLLAAWVEHLRAEAEITINQQIIK